MDDFCIPTVGYHVERIDRDDIPTRPTSMRKSASSPDNSATGKTTLTHRRGHTWTRIGLGIVLLGIALALGRSFGHHIPQVEARLAELGPWSYAVFVGLVVVGTSLFVPDTVFAVIAGALFGVVAGTLVMVAGCLLTAAFDYALARQFLQNAVRPWLERQPKLAAIVQAVDREGFRFQFLLRLTPINPVTVSYVLGATGTRFVPFLVACLGIVPGLFVEVYFGYVAKHMAKVSGGVSEHSTMHSALTIAGLILCVAVLVYVVRIARRALAQAEAENPSQIAHNG